MKYPLIAFVLSLGFQVIGQVRRDTVLYALPVATGKRGRPAKYGDKYNPDAVALLPEVRHWLLLYGKWQWVRYRSEVCLAKFLRGYRVRAVWMQFEGEDGKLSKPRLLISTNSKLSADELFKAYARRWTIEDLFNQMKNGWWWREAWQQSRQVLHRWTQILSAAYALPQLLSMYCSEQMHGLLQLKPWRKKAPMTAGQVRLGLRMFSAMSGFGTGGTRHAGNSSLVQPLANRTTLPIYLKIGKKIEQRTTGQLIRPRRHDDDLTVNL